MTPLGAVLLPGGIRVAGGPFDAMPTGARGLCLEAGATRRAEAAWILDIPDFGVPDPAALRAVLLTMLTAMRAQPLDTYYIGCRAGLGRTGLAMACLAALAGVAKPIPWLRAHYDPRAVETPAQEAMVAAFVAAGPAAGHRPGDRA